MSKTAVIHDWLVTFAGSERVLEQILLLYPDAELFSIVDFLPQTQREFLLNKRVHTSFIQKLPRVKRTYRYFLPLMPLAIERFDLSKFDLIISNSHAVAKGVRTRSTQCHISYCNTPMRYAWDLKDQYLKESGLNRGLKGQCANWLLGRLRTWDFRTANNVDFFVANSKFISERIKRVYGRESTVVYPPVDIDSYKLETAKENFYLTASRMVPYKKIDLIVETFSRMPDKRLVVIGDGPDFKKVKSRATQNIKILGYQPDGVMQDYMQRAKAFVFAAEEDFGIVPVEAQACGTPVVAFGRGGARETVVENKTGIFFENQTKESLTRAIERFEQNENRFNPRSIRSNAEKFGIERFRKEFKGLVNEVVTKKNAKKMGQTAKASVGQLQKDHFRVSQKPLQKL